MENSTFNRQRLKSTEKTVGSSFDYVEPLDFNLDTVSNKIVYPYEDYSISVNLEVQIPERNSCGDGVNTVLYASSDNGTISFFGGSNGGYSNTTTEDENKDYEKGYLSTSWTDISAHNVDKGNRECLGIESINISYNQNFFPVVNIRFVDVRGASLFMPQEKGYREAVKENKNATISINGGSFFKALFSCPSPIFKLTVKGFYGYSATYKLMWTKFTSDFDSENGNFIANVEFAGYLYGIYTDLPMTYISLAPYTEEGSVYWKEQVENGRFTFDNGKGIEKFPELYQTLQQYNMEKAKINPSSFEGTKLTELSEKIDGLVRLNDTFPFNGWINNKNNEYYLKETVNDEGYKFEIKVPDNAIENYKELLDSLYAEYPETFEKYYNMFSNILESCHYNDFYSLGGFNNQKTSGHIIPECYIFVVDTDGRIEECMKGVVSDNLTTINDLRNLNDVLTLTGTTGRIILTESEKQDKIKEFGLDVNTPNRSYRYLYYYVIRTNFLKQINEDLENLKKQEKEERDRIYEETEDSLESLIGYNPSIKNMFKMVFAHVETFMHVYYMYLRKIKDDQNDKQRTLQTFNIGENTLADVPNSFFDAIPPFPNFVRQDENNRSVLQWPENIIGGGIPETELVKTLHNAVNEYDKAVQEAQENIKNYASKVYGTEMFLPLTPYDIINNNNPYKECIQDLEEAKGNSVSQLVNKVSYIFLIRCYYSALVYRGLRTLYTDTKAPKVNGLKNSEYLFKYIGAIEASNLLKALGDKKVPTQFWELLNNKINVKKDGNIGYVLDNFAEPFFNTGDTSSHNIQNINLEKYWLGMGYKNEHNISGNTYLAIPIKEYRSGEKPNETSINDFVYLRKDNTPIKETGINDGFAKIIDSKADFENISNGIRCDNDLKQFIGEDKSYDTFIENFYTKYIGGYLIKQSIINVGSDTEEYEDAYFYDENKDFGNKESKIENNIFYHRDESGKYVQTSFVDCIKNKNYSYNLSLLINDKFYTSFVNNHPCIDTINVICSGCTTANCHNHFIIPDDKSFSIDSLLTTAATPYDKAFLLLFSLPITKEYSYKSLCNNGKSVAKAVLLREGAYYYWRENYSNIKSHFNPDYFGRMFGVNVPIVKIKETTGSNLKAPTLFVQKGDGDFLTWGDINGVRDAEIPSLTSSRKNCLIKYFENWVNNYFEGFNKEISTEELVTNVEEGNEIKVILNPSKISILTKLMVETSIYFDASEVIDIPIYSGYTTYYYGFLKKAFKEFADNVVSVYKNRDLVEDIQRNKFQEVDKLSEHFYLSTYNTLQSLYNRHIAGSKQDRWIIGDNNCDFNDFLFLDSYYNEIGDAIKISSDSLGELLSRFVASSDNKGSVDNSFSVYQYLSSLCQKCEMNLIALPVNPYTITDSEHGMKEVFKPKSFGQDSFRKSDNGCFIGLYTYPNSQHLDIDNDNGLYGYKNDSFLIVDNNGNLSSELPIALRDADKKIPAFGVTYAKQNQCFFKKINVSSANPQVTAPSIQATMNIASRGNDGPNETISYGQDLYSVYSNHSYTCDVEMMGCAQIMPMMYFQLNNIPMFRGVYMIIKVEHNIVAGDMTTKFTGVRMNKNALPLIDSTVLFKKNGEPIYNGENIGVFKQPNFEAKWEDNPNADELENRKNRIAWAFDQTFSCIRPGMQRDGQMKGMCARYTYNVAYGYKEAKTPCVDNSSGSISANGNANQSSYWQNLEKLGYKKVFEDEFYTTEEIKNCIEQKIKNKEFNYGDVLVYWAKTGNRDDSCVKYGHTQIYIGDAKPDECPTGWASSLKNNYGNGIYGGKFIYGNRGVSFRNWKLIIYKADGEIIQ